MAWYYLLGFGDKGWGFALLLAAGMTLLVSLVGLLIGAVIGSLIAWAKISGHRVAPFFTEGLEGFSIDYPEDIDRAERLLAQGAATLPAVSVAER